MLEMGMKVTSGFEMLFADPKYGDNRTVREAKILLEDLAADDSLALPTDEVIAGWKEVSREDDESWMDINFVDFERELNGEGKQKKSSTPAVYGPEPPSGFGDAKTQADLRKMVERFESFLNDEDAGIDGAEMDDMDIDDDDDDDSEDIDDDSEDEDKDVSFDEKEFARMMREMMGMPSEEPDEVVDSPSASATAPTSKGHRIEEIKSSDAGDGADGASEMIEVMEKLEAELNEAGALNLDPTPSQLSALKGKAKAEKSSKDGDLDDESDGEEIDIDFNLAKNLLESFTAQAGTAGPGSNLLGLMGMRLPRDEGDSESTTQYKQRLGR